MNKANKIYLERLRKNDFVNREPTIDYRSTTLKDVIDQFNIMSKYLQKMHENNKYSFP